ncbi:hypothetical protein [Coprobacter tertius]|uniref:Chromosome partition protein Smc n=1 Tax=Coprobacter tertius TaxID=2944915 RepID=A0ABT1ME25_9BACT|nr:hypothetical protein [Coprobacter tertius]MCP9610885.1 hypothetical protein [Coprobacter tertius]
MKSKFFKSMHALWNADAKALDEDENVEVREPASHKPLDEERTKEYVNALLNEQIPASILDKMSEIINSSVPDFVKQSIDKEAEKRNIYNHLLEPFIEYIHFIYEKLQKEGVTTWREEEIKLRNEVKLMTEKAKDAVEKKDELQSLQLSAERQKRALNERIHELEMRVASFEAEKEQIEMEKNALLNKLKVAAVQDKDTQDECDRLRAEISGLEAKMAEMSTDFNSECSIKVDSLQQENIQLKEQITVLQEKEKDCVAGKEAMENMQQEHAAQMVALHQDIENALHAKEELTKLLAEKEQVSHLISEYRLRIEELTSAYEKEQAERLAESASLHEDLDNALRAKEEVTRLHAEKDHLTAVLNDYKKQLAELQQLREKESIESSCRLNEMQQQMEALRNEKIDSTPQEMESLKKTAEEAWQYNEKLLDKIDAMKVEAAEREDRLKTEEEQVKQLKLELLSVNEMLSAVMSRQGKKENEPEQEILQQQFPEPERYIKKTIQGAEKSSDEIKNDNKKTSPSIDEDFSSTREPSVVEEDMPEELNWLVPTRPDTPEMIEKRKAEKRAKEEAERAAVEEKPENKPDPSQMSLW